MREGQVAARPLEWRKRCASDTRCVEVARDEHSVWVRNSTDPDGARLEFSLGATADLFGRIRRGEL